MSCRAPSTCLSYVRSFVTNYIVAKRYILKQKCLNKWIGSALPISTILLLSTLYTEPIPQTPHLFNHRRWCHLANTLKRNVDKRTAKISTSGIPIVGMLYGCFRQRRTIGFSSATAGLLVIIVINIIIIIIFIFIWNPTLSIDVFKRYLKTFVFAQ